MSSSQTQAANTVWTSGCANTKILTYITGEVIYKVVDKWLKTFFHYSNGKEGESYRKKSTIIINDSDDKFWPSRSRDCLMRNGAQRKKASPFLFTFTENKDQTILLLKISFCIIVTKKAIFTNGCNFTLDIYYSQKCNVNPFCKSSARHQLLHNPNNIITTSKEPH